MPIPVIDLFAGPGGLGEGFASLDGSERFDLKLSIEKDAMAHRSLWLRSLYRHVSDKSAYQEYRRAPADRKSRAYASLVAAHPHAVAAARREAWHAELGPALHEEVKDRIDSLLGKEDRWVLIGGPPCQAYSLVGRSRMRRALGPAFETDRRHFLYQEYLKIIADHRPAVFVMENVKGLLSSQVDGGRIFDQILRDLERPAASHRSGDQPEYSIHPITESSSTGVGKYIVRADEFGVPQARHRVILIGVRKDVAKVPPALVPAPSRTSAADAIGDLPALRSGLSRVHDGSGEWLAVVRDGAARIASALREEPVCRLDTIEVIDAVHRAVEEAKDRTSRGSRFLEMPPSTALDSWYADHELQGITAHETRSHMASDLWRYLYSAAFAEVAGRSPTLSDLPPFLMPAHKNIRPGTAQIFADRFRVQLRDRPSTTVTSHISKDGHGFIHYDASQVRSLTAREAARLQTFPDSYEFEGPRTAQLHQIGNAVPPLLAQKIANVVRDVLT